MHYRQLGQTELLVSALGFGAAPIGIPNYLGRDDPADPAFQKRAIEAVRAAVHAGITYFDAAPNYGDGRAESLLGQALEAHRSKVLIATKYAPHAADRSCEKRTEDLLASLERLRTNHVDLLQLHGNCWDEAATAALLKSDLLDWADEMHRRGHCRFTGITAEADSPGLDRLLRTDRFDVLAIVYNLMYQGACDYQRQPPTGIIPLARALGLGVIAMRPATSGLLQKTLHAEFPDLDRKRLTRLALKFALSTPELDCAVVGMRSKEEVWENVELAEDLTQRLDLTKLHDRFDGTPLA
jgi:aryl-alcohol dehydrogenase-like predicted oxidoreductase